MLQLIAKGCTYAEVARRLGISTHTVGTYVKKIYRKLGVHSAGAAVMLATQRGMLK